MTKPFYQITSWQPTDSGADTTLLLDADHPLFAGHFPQLPILPGACMVQLTHQLTTKFIGAEITFDRAATIKFMAMVNPLENNTLDSKLRITRMENSLIRADHQLSFGETLCFKISAFYTIHG